MNKKELKYAIISLVAFLIIIGIIAISSIALPIELKSDRSTNDIVIKWLIYIVIGIFASFLSYMIMKKRIYRINSYFNYIVASFCFLFLLAPRFVSRPVNGAYRWVQILGFTIQPSEIVKPLLIVILSIILFLKRRNTKKIIIDFSVIGFFFVLAIFIQKSNTSALQYVLIGYLMFMISEVNSKIKAGISLGLLSIGTISVFIMYLKIPYFQKRIVDFLYHPSIQAKAATFATELGGIKGVGIGEGIQKYYYLSEAHTDYIFSAIAEEIGLVGILMILILFALLIFFLFYAAVNLKDRFNRYIALGVAFNITNQILLHISINLQLLPATGITLPFISYGGSSLVANLMSIGLILYAIDTDEDRSLN